MKKLLSVTLYPVIVGLMQENAFWMIWGGLTKKAGKFDFLKIMKSDRESVVEHRHGLGFKNKTIFARLM